MSQWADEQIHQLESEDYWDYSGKPELMKPSPAKSRGSVASVRFTVEDFRRVGMAAELAGLGIVEYIRRAALAAAEAQLASVPSQNRRRSKQVPKAGSAGVTPQA